MKKTKQTSRKVALDLLKKILQQHKSLAEELEKHEGFASLEKRDRAFAHLLVMTCLRRLGQIDAVMNSCLERKCRLKDSVKDLLRIGIAQILFLKTPPYAAVNSCVELAGKNKNTIHHKNFINAVLRKIAGKADSENYEKNAGRINTPDWLWSKWQKTYGTETALKITEAHLSEPPLDITVKEDTEKWAKKLNAKILPTGTLRLYDSFAVEKIPGFTEGKWWVQDAASALPIKLFGELRGKKVLDLCAAPGGKTLQLAAAGAQVTAVDVSSKRLEKLKENLIRCSLDAKIICKDILAFHPAEKYRFILLDAPCSSTGTIRRHPDIARTKTPKDVIRMAKIQKLLLDYTVENLLADGGVLIYSVCSLEAEEGEKQIEALLKINSSLKRIPITPKEIGGCSEFITSEGDLRCLPSHWPKLGGLDGFYACRLEKA